MDLYVSRSPESKKNLILAVELCMCTCYQYNYKKIIVKFPKSVSQVNDLSEFINKMRDSSLESLDGSASW